MARRLQSGNSVTLQRTWALFEDRMLASVNPDRRPTIGFLVDALFGGYQETVWKSIANAAEAFDLNLLCFLGGSLWHSQFSKTVYELISERNVDGLIVLSGSLGCFFTEEELEAHYRSLPPIPIVSISKKVPGLPTILVDNEAGVRQLLTHLIEFHGRRRIAFIRGPVTNSEAEMRFKAYRESLEHHGLPFEPNRVFVGDFDRPAGFRAIQAFLDERKIEFDAVVGANDYMAIYAMRELQRRGVRVPDDVAVAGFDDIPDTASVIPPMTTICQPLFDIGKDAILKTLALIRGESVPEVSVFPARLVVRRSCGCTLPTDEDSFQDYRESTVELASAKAGGAGLAEQLETLFPEQKERLRRPSWAKELADALLDELSGRPEGQFLKLLESFIALGLEHEMAASKWYKVLGIAFRAVRPDFAVNEAERFDSLWESALILVGNLAEHAQIALRLRAEDEFRILPRLLVITQLNEEEIKQVILDELPALGVRSFYLSRFTDDTRKNALLSIYYALSSHVVLDPALDVFPSERLIPGHFSKDHRYAYVVLPIRSRADHFGFAICEMGSLSGGAYETLLIQISTALKVTSLVDEVRRHANELEAKVDERTRQLREAQERLVEAARQAGMAEIAIGVMHNVGNLLNSVNISAEEIGEIAHRSKVEGLMKANELLKSHQDDLAAFFAKEPRAKLLPDYYCQVALGIDQERARIQSEVEELRDKTSLIRETIKALQEYARGGGDVLLREAIEIPALVDAVLKIQEPLLARLGVRVRKDLEAVSPIVAQRTKVVHILLNIVKNAIEAMRSAPEGERDLTIEVRRHAGGGVLVRVSDTGEGIPRENLDKIFSHGFTTKVDGYGFGLHTCAKHMNQMGGTISAESDGQGRGTTFTLEFHTSS